MPHALPPEGQGREERMAEFGDFAHAMLRLWTRVRHVDGFTGYQDVSAERFRLAFEVGAEPTQLGYEADEVFDAMCVIADVQNSDPTTWEEF